MDILWLGNEACHDITAVGGKVANLSRLAAGFRVPHGFCLTTEALERWAPAQEGIDPPAGLREALTAAYEDLAGLCGCASPSVAVRSSAVDEDGRMASFAGQYETYLNVVGVEAMVQAVVRCWGSLRSHRAMAYRRKYGLSTDRIRLAVLIQQLVAAEVAAVVFSANPVTRDRGEVVINASWGLGESIVGGTVTPDTYVVRKADMAVVSQQVSQKERMTVSVPGGTREVAVPRFLRGQATLEGDQAVEMAKLAVDLESRLGWPVDLECAWHARELFLLQCRPITTLVDPDQTTP